MMIFAKTWQWLDAMISTIPSYDEDILKSAYANISLIADNIWANDQEDPYKKLNKNLWIKVIFWKFFRVICTN